MPSPVLGLRRPTMMAALFAPLSAGWLRILRDKGTEWTVLRSGRSPYGSKRTGGG